jgi:ubiquinone/menaquinone biosynthesis C-methylase UbiE
MRLLQYMSSCASRLAITLRATRGKLRNLEPFGLGNANVLQPNYDLTIMKHKHPRPFHDYEHAREYDRRASKSDFLALLEARLLNLLGLDGSETLLDIATGTGRFARPVAAQLKSGALFGVDGAAAMLRVGREEMEIPLFTHYFQVVGLAQALPFTSGIFDHAFAAFAFHHFGGAPVEVVREAHRVLKPAGRFVILDPVLHEPRDRVDHAVHDFVQHVFRRTHGEDFRFYSVAEIRAILRNGALWKAIAADVHRLSFDRPDMDGIPTGPHWVEAAAELEGQPEAVRRRFEEKYFRYVKEGEGYRVTGSLSYAMVWATK